MGSKNKVISLLLIVVLTASSLMMAEYASAQTIPKPSIPQFSLELLGLSVQITIENQPVVLTMENAINASIYYNVRVKDHSSIKWTELYTNNRPDLPNMKGTVPIQSDSQYTVLYYSIGSYSQGSELDFQVIAMYGIYTLQEPASGSPFIPDYTDFGILADGQSGWSQTQTFIVPENSVTPTQFPTQSPRENATPINNFNTNTLLMIISITVIAIAILLVIIAFLLFYLRRQKGSDSKSL